MRTTVLLSLFVAFLLSVVPIRAAPVCGKFWQGKCAPDAGNGTQAEPLVHRSVQNVQVEKPKLKTKRWGKAGDECVPIVEVVIEGIPEPVPVSFRKRIAHALLLASHDPQAAEEEYSVVRAKIAAYGPMSKDDVGTLFSGMADVKLALEDYECAERLLARAYKITGNPDFLRRLSAVYAARNDKIGHVTAGCELVKALLRRGRIAEALREAAGIYQRYSNDRWAISMLMHAISSADVDGKLAELLTLKVTELGVGTGAVSKGPDFLLSSEVPKDESRSLIKKVFGGKHEKGRRVYHD